MLKPPKPGSAEAALRSHALSYPEAHEEFPWGKTLVAALAQPPKPPKATRRR